MSGLFSMKKPKIPKPPPIPEPQVMPDPDDEANEIARKKQMQSMARAGRAGTILSGDGTDYSGTTLGIT